MYNNPFYNPYQAPIMTPTAAMAAMEIQKVTGEAGAQAFPMGANSSVMLLDTTDPIVWVVTTDASAYKTITPYSITPYVREKPVTATDLKEQMEAINTRIRKLEERMDAHGEPDHGAAEQI